MANRVIHFDIQADDPARAKKFYEEAFGWEIKPAMTKAEGGAMDYWMIMTGPDGTPGINGGMSERPKAGPDRLDTLSCTILVPDIDQAVAAVKKNGGKITREKMELPEVGWFAAGLDPEGNRLSLMQATTWQPH